MIPGDKLTVCKVLFDQDDDTVFIIGVLSIGGASFFEMYPGSSKADEDWKRPDTCESTGAARYQL